MKRILRQNPAGGRIRQAAPCPTFAVVLTLALATGPWLRGADQAAGEASVFAHSGRCAMCHDSDPRALRDARGTDLSPVADWRATMMANSFRDPLWQAKVEREIEENPSLKGLIEDKCTRCHAPMAHAQSHLDGNKPFTLAAARKSELAADGVSCTLCHQIRDQKLGKPASFTGGFHIGQDRKIFGPYPDEDIFPMPMRNQVDYTPVHGPHVGKSELCATCHTLFTPILDAANQVTGEFPEQTPYLEWRNSDFAREGKQCQDCHMPKVDEAVKISSRPPWLDNLQQPFWRHGFVGGNTLVPAMLAKQSGSTTTADEFAAVVDRAQRQLRKATAKLSLHTSVEDHKLIAEVTVENLTGHKFPTGFPSRRAWLHVTATDSTGKVLFESGAHRKGRLVHEPDQPQPHHREIHSPGQTQIYEAVMADHAGKPTTTLLRAASYWKDNRLPPLGFRSGGRADAACAIHGDATQDPDFARDGSGRDSVRYRIPLKDTPATGVVVTAELLYQVIKPDFAAHLTAGQGERASAFRKLHQSADLSPRLVARAVQR